MKKQKRSFASRLNPFRWVGAGIAEGAESQMGPLEARVDAQKDDVQLRLKAEKDDVQFNKAVIDKQSLEIISGSTVDFKKEMIGESFSIDNPKASASCGCGLSFSV